MEHVKNRIGFLFESPQDPKTCLKDGAGDESASFWAWDETHSFLAKYEHVGMKLINFDQGACGHARKKPTTCMSNLPDMSELGECRSGEKERNLAAHLDERLQQTTSWSLWAPGLRAAVRTSLLVLGAWVNCMGCQHRSFQKVWGLNSGANTSPKVTNPTDGTVGHVCSTWQGLNHIGSGNTMGVLLGQWRLIWFRVQKPGILPPERWSDTLWLPLHWFPFLMGKKTKKKT